MVLLAVVAVAIGGIFAYKSKQQKEYDQTHAFQDSSLKERYYMQNNAFGMKIDDDSETYLPFEEGSYVLGYLYPTLVYYEKQTGITLTLEQVSEYFSQEYEKDGSVRIFSNGNHPEISKFIYWYYTVPNQYNTNEYIKSISRIFNQYAKENHLEDYYFIDLELDSMKELIKKEEDPNYKMQRLVIRPEVLERHASQNQLPTW